MVSPPWKHVFAPPPTRIEIGAAVRHCAAEASIPVLSAKLVFANAAVCTPLTVCVCVACARHDPGGGEVGGGGGGGGETTSFWIVMVKAAEPAVVFAASR